MKLTHYILLICVAGALALAGCGKSGSQAPPAPRPGVVDLGPLQQAFPAPTPEITTSFNKLRFATRYRQFEVALVELDNLAKLPNLTEPQKKAVADLIEQVKVAINTPPPKPSQ